jgi:hypothetical protein
LYIVRVALTIEKLFVSGGTILIPTKVLTMRIMYEIRTTILMRNNAKKPRPAIMRFLHKGGTCHKYLASLEVNITKDVRKGVTHTIFIIHMNTR